MPSKGKPQLSVVMSDRHDREMNTINDLLS